MGDPQEGYPVIHIAGTNGKSSTVRLAAAIVAGHGLVPGTFISPHLERIEQRFGIAGRDMTPTEFATAVADVAPFVDLYEARQSEGPTYFELTAAIAFSWFASQAVDVAIVEVGLGGRLDATNVLAADVAVITGIGSDHTEYLGEHLGDIAAEKAAIVDAGTPLVTGPLPPEAEEAVAARVAAMSAPWRQFDVDFAVDDAALAVGGWLCDVGGIFERYDAVFLPLHGRHQVQNLAVAIAASEDLIGRALEP